MKVPVKVTQFVDAVRIFEHRNRPTILTGLGVAGLWTTAYLSYKAGPRAKDILAAKRQDMNDIRPGDKETKRTVMWETVKEMVPVVGPPILLGSVSTACIIGSNTVSSHRIATLSAAYTITDTALREYKGKVTELLGEKKAQQIREAISHDHVQQSPPPENEEKITRTGNGNTLCYDEYTDRYFYSSAEAIGEAIVKLSYDLQSEMWIELNEFYMELGLRPCKMGNDLGWSIDHTDRGRIPVYYTATLTEDKRPCLAIQFDVETRERY